MEDELQAEFIDDLDDARAARLIGDMEPDDAADIVRDLPYEKAETLLRLMGVEDATEIRRLLGYKDGTAGGMITTQYVAVPKETTVRETIEVLRDLDEDHPTVHYVYVTDDYGKLIGRSSRCAPWLNRRRQATRRHHVRLDDLGDPGETEEDVAADIFKYDLPAMPVVDERAARCSASSPPRTRGTPSKTTSRATRPRPRCSRRSASRSRPFCFCALHPGPDPSYTVPEI